MAANTTPIFTLTPVIGQARLITSSSFRDGSEVTQLLSAGADGTRIDTITFTSAPTASAYTVNTAMVGRVFISDTAGSNYRLFQEVDISAVTPSVSAIGATQTISFVGGLNIPSGSKIAVNKSAHAGVQDVIDVIARGGNY